MKDYNPKEKYKSLDIHDSAEDSEENKPIPVDQRELYKKETTPRAS